MSDKEIKITYLPAKKARGAQCVTRHSTLKMKRSKKIKIEPVKEVA